MKDINKTKEKLINELQVLRKKNNSLKTSYYNNIELKRIDEHEKKYTEFLQNIIASITHPFYVLDANNYTVILANRHTDSYIQGKTTCYQLTHKRDIPCNEIDHPCTIELVKSTGKSVITEHVHYDSNDNIRNVEIHAHPVFDENGSIHQIIEYIVDITERKKTENNLIGLKNAICASSDSVFLTDLDGIITFVNPGFTELYGYTAEEVVDKFTPRILKSGILQQSVYEQFWQKLLKKEEVRGELINKRKNETLVEIEATSNAIIDDNNNIIGFLSIQRDITERKQNEMIIQQQNQVLHELNATKDKFFSIIAHDLRSPFNTIINFSHLLKENIDEYDDKEIKYLINFINNAANKTFILLENLLEWSKLQQGLINPNLIKHNFKTIVAEICMLYSEIAAAKKVTLHNEIRSDFFIKCDEDMIKTVLRNLISNAIKFSEEDSIVSIDANLQRSVLEVQIKDTGIGIPHNNIQHLFSIDNNISTPGTAGEKGTGLGLILCKELIEKQGGKIWVESKKGKGSIFHFTLNRFEEKLSRTPRRVNGNYNLKAKLI